MEPAPLVRLEDYNGPFEKAVGRFSGKLDRKPVREPRYRAGAALCTLEPVAGALGDDR